jgi:molecular chaperone DnaJ
MVTACPHCRGRGRVVVDKCADCRGRGRVAVKRVLTVKIPAGVHDGQAVRVTGEGEPPRPEINAEGKGIRGDLHVVVRVRAHETFEREEDHLLIALPVAFSQLALGATIDVPTMDGRTSLTIPAGAQHGSIFRIEGHGLPNLKSGRRGDLIVIVQLVVPRKLTDDQKKLLHAFAETESIEVDSSERASLWERIKGAVKG